MEFHWPGYQYMGPGTHLKKGLAREDPGINRLDRIAKAHDIDYDKARNLQDKWVADRKMIAKIDQLPGRKTLTERIVKKIMKAKLRLGMSTKKDTLFCTYTCLINLCSYKYWSFALTRSYEWFAPCPPPPQARTLPSPTVKERDGPNARPTSYTFCVALTRHV